MALIQIPRSCSPKFPIRSIGGKRPLGAFRRLLQYRTRSASYYVVAAPECRQQRIAEHLIYRHGKRVAAVIEMDDLEQLKHLAEVRAATQE